MNEREPFESLRDLVDQPVAPDARFAADLKSQLMSGMTASGRNHSWEEEHPSVDITYRPSLVAMPEQVRKRRFKPLILLEIAAVAALLIGIAAAIGSGLFSSDPDDQPTIPAAALQDDSAATPAVVPPADTMEPTVVPPMGAKWQLPLPEGESLDIGGMAVHDGVVYRLLTTPSFSGVEAVDSATGSILWKASYGWRGFELQADEHFVYFEWGPGTTGEGTIAALDATDGNGDWSLELDGFLMGMTLQDGILFVEDNRNTLKAIQDGTLLWEQPIDPDYNESLPDEVVSGFNDPVANGEVIVAMSETGVISAFDIESGNRLWTSDRAYPPETFLTVAGEMLVVISASDPSAAVGGVAVANAVGGDATSGDMAPGAEITHFGAPFAGGSGSSSSSASGSGGDGGMIPTVSSFTASNDYQWSATGLSLADGTVVWKSDISGQVWQSAAIEDTVAYVAVQGGLDDSPTAALPQNTLVYGLNAATGEIIWSVSADETLFTWLGTWIPSEGGQELFVAVVYEVTANEISDSSLVVVDPHNQGRTEDAEIPLEQVVISEPQGDQNGLYLTLLDGTLIALPSTTVIDGE